MAEPVLSLVQWLSQSYLGPNLLEVLVQEQGLRKINVMQICFDTGLPPFQNRFFRNCSTMYNKGDGGEGSTRSYLVTPNTQDFCPEMQHVLFYPVLNPDGSSKSMKTIPQAIVSCTNVEKRMPNWDLPNHPV